MKHLSSTDLDERVLKRLSIFRHTDHEHRGVKFVLEEEERRMGDGGGTKLHVFIPRMKRRWGPYSTKNEALDAAKSIVEELLETKRLSVGDTDEPVSKRLSGGEIRVGSKTFTWENNPNTAKLDLFDEDGEHIGQAPDVAKAKEFLEREIRKGTLSSTRLARAVQQQVYKGRQIVVLEDGRLFHGEIDGKRVFNGMSSRAGVLEACREEIDDHAPGAQLSAAALDRCVMKRLAQSFKIGDRVTFKGFGPELKAEVTAKRNEMVYDVKLLQPYKEFAEGDVIPAHVRDLKK